MKRGATPLLKSSRLKGIFLFIFLLGTAVMQAQDTTQQPVDSVKTGFSLGKILLDNPDSIVAKYSYDPKIDR